MNCPGRPGERAASGQQASTVRSGTVFRRRKSDSADLSSDDAGELDARQISDLGDEVAEDGPEPRADGGPWDATEAFAERDRVDLGCLWVPVGPDFEIQLVMAEQQGAWVTARHGESELQMQVFAASRSDSLWDDVRAEIAAEVQAAGGSSQESDGPLCITLIARAPAEPGARETGMRSATPRFARTCSAPRWSTAEPSPSRRATASSSGARRTPSRRWRPRQLR